MVYIIRFNHRFETFKRLLWPEVDINARREVDSINTDRGPDQMLNTENPWLNVITHSKFISSPFISLFATVIPIFSPSISLLYRDAQVNLPLK